MDEFLILTLPDLAPIQSTTSTIPVVPMEGLTFRTFTIPHVSSPRAAPTRQSRLCRLREGWLLNGSESFETSIRSSNTNEVGLPLQYSTSTITKEIHNRKFSPWADEDALKPRSYVLSNRYSISVILFDGHELTHFLRSCSLGRARP